jgi:hypothetical protein
MGAGGPDLDFRHGKWAQSQCWPSRASILESGLNPWMEFSKTARFRNVFYLIPVSTENEASDALSWPAQPRHAEL